MSSTPYHHGRLREALVEEAVSAARERGPDGLALRELARRVGVSHNAAYRHFADRAALVAAVADVATQELMRAMEQRLAPIDSDDPVLRARLRLAGVGRSYVHFALDEPGLFRVAFEHRSHPEGMDLRTSGAYLLLGGVLDELVAVGFLSPEARVGAVATCWSAVHGFSLLAIDGPLSVLTGAERDATLDQVLVALDRSFGASTGRDHVGSETVVQHGTVRGGPGQTGSPVSTG